MRNFERKAACQNFLESAFLAAAFGRSERPTRVASKRQARPFVTLLWRTHPATDPVSEFVAGDDRTES